MVFLAARTVLGNHINQAGAKKTGEKAHLDVTHYENISDSDMNKIEKLANKMVKGDFTVKKSFMARSEAEKKFGMRLYQGGAVPGKNIRVVEIKGVDVQACGGTHLNKTGEIGVIRIIKSNKIQDGVVRITFTAGKAAEKREESVEDTLKKASKLLAVSIEQIPARAEELFEKWKKGKKALKKGKSIIESELELSKIQEYKGDVLAKTAEALKTQKEHVLNTISRFKKELDEMRKELDR